MLRTALFAAGLMGVALGAQAQQDYVVLNPIPAFSQPLERGRDGNYYSVSNGYATFKVTPAGQYSYLGGVLVSATAVDGGDGYFYASSNRDIIRFAEGGAASIVHHFDYGTVIGVSPLAMAGDGMIYGLATMGDRTDLFRLAATGAPTVVGAFPGSNGWRSRLLSGADGSLYGTADGVNGRVFRVSAGVVSTVHAFTGQAGGADPSPFLLQTSDGALYGGTSKGGAADSGILFRVTVEGAFTVLTSLPAEPNPGLTAPLMLGRDGNFYGTTEAMLFRLTAAGELTPLHSTLRESEAYLWADRYGAGLAGVFEGTSGDFFGTTKGGGLVEPGGGVLFRVNRMRARCTNVVRAAWAGDRQQLFVDGAVKTETPALYGAWLVTPFGSATLWKAAIPRIDPTYLWLHRISMPSAGTVGVFSLLVTSTLDVCADWKTVDTGGAGPSTVRVPDSDD